MSLFAQNENGRDVSIKSPYAALSLCWNRDDSLFAYTEKNTIFIRNSNDYSIAYVLNFPGVLSVAFCSEGENELLMAVSNSGIVSIWNYTSSVNPEMSQNYSESENVICSAFSADSDSIALGLEDGSIILYYKLRFIKQMMAKILLGHSEPVFYLSFTSDNEYLASASTDGTLKIWKTSSGKLVREFEIYAKNKIPFAWINDSKRIAFATSEKEISIQSVEENDENGAMIFSETKIRGMKSFRKENFLAVLTEKNTIDFYNLDTMENYGYLPPKSDSDIVSYEFNSDDMYLLIGYKDGTVAKVNVKENTLLPGEISDKLIVVDDDEVEFKGENKGAEGNNKRKEQIVLYKNEDFISLNCVSMILSSPFVCSVGGDAALKIGSLITPFYFGLGIGFNVGFPSDPFPYKYGVANSELNPPNIYSFDFYVPFGLRLISGPNKFNICLEIRAGVRSMFLWNGQQENSARGNDYFAALLGFDAIYYMGPIGVGIGFDFDSILLAKPKFILGGKIPVPVVKSIKKSVQNSKIKRQKKAIENKKMAEKLKNGEVQQKDTETQKKEADVHSKDTESQLKVDDFAAEMKTGEVND